MGIATINPATGETLETFEPLSAAALEKKLARAQGAFHKHRKSAIPARAGKLRRAAEILDAEKEQLGRLMTLEMGKTIASAIAEAQKCALACRYYADNAERLLAPEEVPSDAGRSYVAFQPLGPILAVMPLNFPFPATDVGPLATASVAAELEEQVRASVAHGALLLTGGKRIKGRGNYFAPTVLTDVRSPAPAADEELFGPVAAIFRASDLDDAIRIANATRFGLGASAWTRDPAEQQRLASEIEAGQVFINSMVVSDPRLPFGGIKQSGYGRELSVYGLREFVNVKTIWIADKERPREAPATE